MKPFSASVVNASRSLEPSRAEREAVAAQAVEEVRHLARHDQLRVREGVHQEHLVPIRERDTNIENRGLHGFLLDLTAELFIGNRRLRTPAACPARSLQWSCATDIPVPAQTCPKSRIEVSTVRAQPRKYCVGRYDSL